MSGQKIDSEQPSFNLGSPEKKQEKDEPLIQQFNFTEPTTESVLNNEELDQFLDNLENGHSSNLNDSSNTRGGIVKQLETNSSTIEAMKSEIQQNNQIIKDLANQVDHERYMEQNVKPVLPVLYTDDFFEKEHIGTISDFKNLNPEKFIVTKTDMQWDDQ